MTGRQKSRQRDRLLDLLKRRPLQWIPLPDILALGIAQYNARIYELRRAGYRIENKQEGDHSWFRLVVGSAIASNKTHESEPGRLFPDDAPRRYLDLG